MSSVTDDDDDGDSFPRTEVVDDDYADIDIEFINGLGLPAGTRSRLHTLRIRRAPDLYLWAQKTIKGESSPYDVFPNSKARTIQDYTALQAALRNYIQREDALRREWLWRQVANRPQAVVYLADDGYQPDAWEAPQVTFLNPAVPADALIHLSGKDKKELSRDYVALIDVPLSPLAEIMARVRQLQQTDLRFERILILTWYCAEAQQSALESQGPKVTTADVLWAVITDLANQEEDQRTTEKKIRARLMMRDLRPAGTIADETDEVIQE